jgi:methenyltetrahydromethanopterin cyclohydrolase
VLPLVASQENAVVQTLNEGAKVVADSMASNSSALRLEVHNVGGARIIDCGVKVKGSVHGGLGLAWACVANLANITLVPGAVDGFACPHVHFWTDQPVLACMASQYAGWQISAGKFFAMGSGPMRALYGKEALFDHLPGREKSPVAVGVLESRKLPTEEVVTYLCQQLGISSSQLTLLVAPASSMAGTLQVVARSVETALHKLHELGFEVMQVLSAQGWAPLPPVATDEISAIGRTNDAILYGGRVVLWVDADDEKLVETGHKVPSSSSRDYGAPFAEIFERAGRDFYKIDKMLFSPAELVLYNLRSGRHHKFGQLAPEILRRSFGA